MGSPFDELVFDEDVVEAAPPEPAKAEPMSVGSELRKELATLPPGVLTIATPEHYASACHAVSVRKDFIKNAKAKLDPICDAAHKAWKATTELRREIIEPVENDVKRYGKAIVDYDNKLRAEAEAAARAAEEAARKAEAEAQAANDAAAPWEQKVDVAEAVQQAVAQVERKVEVPQAVAGVSTKFKPWAARVTDMKKFLQFVIEKERFELVQPDQTQLNALAKKLGADMGNVYPGTEGYRERIISSR